MNRFPNKILKYSTSRNPSSERRVFLCRRTDGETDRRTNIRI